MDLGCDMNVRDLRTAFITAKTRFDRVVAQHDATWNRPYIDDILAITIAKMSPEIKKELLANHPEQKPLIDEFEIRQRGGL